MYHVSDTGPAPGPLDFHTPRHADSVADALGPDVCPHDESPVPALDVAALLTEAGLSAPAVREILARSADPGR